MPDSDKIPHSALRIPHSDVDIDRVAELARIELTPAEKERAQSELANIVAYMGQLNEVDTSGVEPLHHVLDLRNVLREDEPRLSLPVEEALANAPVRKGDYFLVPRVIE
jgi:aspartyl-tRNA(Asn)/glutamyl-tRNA(Gln) amidotransferase subunit C